MKSLLGKILKNRYYVARQLAKKNYWTIYLAEDRIASIEPLCVVKRLQIPKEVKNLSSLAWNELRDLVTLEVMRLKQIDQHPQIPEIRDFFIINQDFYIVRDFIKGETLAEEIAHHPLTEAEVILILKEILKCLDFIHQKNLLHLSLKPSNIIRQKEDGKIFLTILSKLKRLAEDHCWQPRFLANQYLEDQEFIAPEYQQGNPVIASDIYTLGKIAIYALSGSKSNKVEINNLDHLARSAIRDLNSNQE
ncbi:MAG: serine/threonine protein kinase, partial [Xenococcus sp. (in: cyanobacteria)]